MSLIHRNFAFKNSRMMSGSIGPVERGRVCELWSDDPDRPCSPAHRAACPLLTHILVTSDIAILPVASLKLIILINEVQQRGVMGTRSILEAMVSGVDAPADAPVFVVDLTLNRQDHWMMHSSMMHDACIESETGVSAFCQSEGGTNLVGLPGTCSVKAWLQGIRATTGSTWLTCSWAMTK